jgi:hypothetical protein
VGALLWKRGAAAARSKCAIDSTISASGAARCSDSMRTTRPVLAAAATSMPTARRERYNSAAIPPARPCSSSVHARGLAAAGSSVGALEKGHGRPSRKHQTYTCALAASVRLLVHTLLRHTRTPILARSATLPRLSSAGRASTAKASVEPACDSSK